MLSTAEYLNTLYVYRSKADLQFRNVTEQVNEILWTKEEIKLTFPGNIDEQCHNAFWNYASIQSEVKSEDEDDDEDRTYLFKEIYIGLCVTTTQFHGYDDIRPFLTAYIAAQDGHKDVELFNYDLGEELDMEKIVNDIAATVGTIRDLEIMISNMIPEKAETALNLLNKLLER
jgi:hypothetical protein